MNFKAVSGYKRGNEYFIGGDRQAGDEPVMVYIPDKSTTLTNHVEKELFGGIFIDCGRKDGICKSIFKYKGDIYVNEVETDDLDVRYESDMKFINSVKDADHE